MKKNIQNLVKRDLEVIPLIAYFIVYFLYLLFDRILELKDYAILVNPIIIPIIAFLYITNKKSKRSALNLFLLIMIFISDNSTLLEIRSFYVYATIIYMISTCILFYYALLDMKFVVRKGYDRKKIAYVLLGMFFVFLTYCFLNYNFKDKAAEKFIVFGFMLVFLLLFLLSLFNYIQWKTKKTKFLFLMVLCMLLSDVCFSMVRYYDGNVIFKYVVFIFEIPVYYFLLRYLLLRDKEIAIVQ